MKVTNDARLARVMDAFGIDSSTFLGQGGESWVIALDDERIARVNPAGTSRVQSVAQEWLVACSLADLYAAAQDWIAAYWSFARDDISVYRWCRAILVE